MDAETMDSDLPENINYWIANSSKHDCFFKFGQDPDTVVKIGGIKILLIGCSEVFRKMLDESVMAEKADINITDSDPKTFTNFLKCIYGGTEIVLLKLSFEEIVKLLYLCDKYLISNLKQQISSFIHKIYQPLTVKNTLIALSSSVCLQDADMKILMTETIQTETESILKHEWFLQLNHNALVFIAEHDRLSISEANLWNFFLTWAKNQRLINDPGKDERTYLGKILSLIRFCTMTSQELCSLVVPTKVLTPVEVFEICNSIGTKTPPKLTTLSRRMSQRRREPLQRLMFTYVVNDIYNFSKVQKSKEFGCGDYKWILKVINNSDGLGIGFTCKNDTLLSKWKCLTSANITLVNHFGKPDAKTTLFDMMFSSKENKKVSLGIFSWDFVVNPRNGFVKNNSIEILVKLFTY